MQHKQNRINIRSIAKVLDKKKAACIGISLGMAMVMLHQAMNTKASIADTNLHHLLTKTTWNNANGNYLYYGNYQGTPVKYRILEYDGDKMLLDCDIGIYPLPYYIEGSDNQSEYNNQIYESINGADFLENETIFTTTLRETILETNVQEDSYSKQRKDGTWVDYLDEQRESQIFLLTANQIDKYYPEVEERIKSNSQEDSYYWLSSQGKLEDRIYAMSIDPRGTSCYMNSDSELPLVSPSFWIETETIAYIWPANTKKTYLTEMPDVSENSEWIPSLESGEGFKAKQKVGSKDWSLGGNEITYTIQNIGTKADHITYNQVSAIVYDQDKNIRAYGKVANADTTEITVTIPDNLLEEYLYVAIFMEQAGTKTDYASNQILTEIAYQGEPEVEAQDESQENDTEVEETETYTPDTNTSITPQVYYINKETVTEEETSYNQPDVIAFDYTSGKGSVSLLTDGTGVIGDGMTLSDSLQEVTTTETLTQTSYETNSYYEDIEEITYETEEGCSDWHRYRFVILLNALAIQRIFWKIREKKQRKKYEENMRILKDYYA